MLSFKVSWKIHLLGFLICCGICIMMKEFIDSLLLGILIEKKFLNITGNIYIDYMLYIMIILIPMTFIHEVLHGILYKLFGGKVKYGFKVEYAYAQEIY